MKDNDFLKTRKIFEKRIDRLINHQFYIESVFLMAAIMERELQAIILRYENLIRVSLNLQQKDIKFSIKQFTKKDIEKMMLGEMINFLSFCFPSKKILLKKLTNFNQLRIKVVHKLYEIESLSFLENEIKNSSLNFWDFLADLTELEVLLINEEIATSSIKLRQIEK